MYDKTCYQFNVERKVVNKMMYKMKCPMCEQEIQVEEDMEDEALVKMMEVGRKHLDESHKDAPRMTEEEMEKMIKENWEKE